MSHANRSPLVRVLTKTASAVIAVSMQERSDNVARLSVLQSAIGFAIEEQADLGTTTYRALDVLRDRVRGLLPFAEIHDRHMRGELNDIEWNIALQAARTAEQQ